MKLMYDLPKADEEAFLAASESGAKRMYCLPFDILEDEIRETPHNWLWTHKRWK